jgi:hypothetical protein
METADGPTDMIAQGAQAGSDHGRLLEKTTGDSSSHPRNKRCLCVLAKRQGKLSQSFPEFAGNMTAIATCSTALSTAKSPA